jgi:hypothetical protein
MPELPELARLVRLTHDELCLIAWYRHCTPEQREYIQDIVSQLAEQRIAETSANVVTIHSKPRQA